jgi:hypothetical protein
MWILSSIRILNRVVFITERAQAAIIYSEVDIIKLYI